MSEQAGMQAVAIVYRETKLGYTTINAWESLRGQICI